MCWPNFDGLRLARTGSVSARYRSYVTGLEVPGRLSWDITLSLPFFLYPCLGQVAVFGWLGPVLVNSVSLAECRRCAPLEHRLTVLVSLIASRDGLQHLLAGRPGAASMLFRRADVGAPGRFYRAARRPLKVAFALSRSELRDTSPWGLHGWPGPALSWRQWRGCWAALIIGTFD